MSERNTDPRSESGAASGVDDSSATLPAPLKPLAHDHHLLRDADDKDDWAWRRAIRQRPAALAAYRALVLAVGGVLVLGGLALVPLPGPGWLVVLLGLAILASEFEPAQRLLEFVKARLHAWNQWVRSQPRWVQFVFALLTAAFVLAVVWLTLRVGGIPGLLPLGVVDWLVHYGHLPRPPS